MKKLLLVTLFVSSIFGFSQQTKSNLRVNARAQKDKILIRWAIDQPNDWQRGNKQGFIVTRFVVKRGGKLLSDPEKLVLTPKPLLPEPLETWMDLIQKDNYAAIIAQAIYGESFEVGGAKEGELSKIVSINDELNQRFTFSLYAADMSFEGSLKAGWAFVDTQVKPNEEYAYQISVAGKTKIAPASYLIGLKDFMSLPVPSDFKAIPDDKQIVLSWDYETYKMIYASYMIEKSTDGIHFSPISKTPIVKLNDQNGVGKGIYYIDTFENNEVMNYYRLYGISPFGEKGEMTDVIKEKGISSLVVSPRIINYQIINQDKAIITWEYPAAAEPHIASFEVNVADQDQGPYRKVAEKLGPHIRSIAYNELRASNYFTVTVVGKNNRKLTSQSMLIQPTDSIAPAKPVGLEGVIDSLGVVRLKWKANIEKDVAGYRILKANNEKEEFVDIYGKPYEDIHFEDKADLTMSNKKVFYRIIAEDRRYNMSVPSDVLVLEKPDKIPPMPPVFKDFETKNGKIKLQWVKSYSDDVVLHSLRRREKGQTSWEEIKQFVDDVQEYEDATAVKNKLYEYAILAKDKSNLWSSIEQATITVQARDVAPIKVLRNIETLIDTNNKSITLSWGYEKGKEKTEEKVVTLSIYKGIKGQPTSLWKEVPAATTQVTDTTIKTGTEYEYQLAPTLNTQTPARIERITVKF